MPARVRRRVRCSARVTIRWLSTSPVQIVKVARGTRRSDLRSTGPDSIEDGPEDPIIVDLIGSIYMVKVAHEDPYPTVAAQFSKIRFVARKVQSPRRTPHDYHLAKFVLRRISGVNVECGLRHAVHVDDIILLAIL